MGSSFVCSSCGETHEGLPTDYGWQLPDEVWAIPEPIRSERAKYNGDLCQLGDRRFIRCLLKLPFRRGDDDYYAWGVWIELSPRDFDRYVELYDEDGSAEPRVSGSIANSIPGYAETLRLPAMVQFQDSSSRPTVHVPSTTDHALASDQFDGIDDRRYHEILASIGR